MLKYYREYRWADIQQIQRNDRAAQRHTDHRLDGKHIVITGATSGVGWAAVQTLAAHGADILMINRSREKSEDACQKLREMFHATCDYLIADFSNLADVKQVANTLIQTQHPIDVLINNVGMHSTTLQRTTRGTELVFCVNHLASFLLTRALIPSLKRQAHSRIIHVNSQGHRFGGLNADDLDWRKRHYTGLRGYGASKTAQLLTLWELADRLQDSGVTINAMHPGAVHSNIGLNNGPLYRWFKKTVLSRSLKDTAIAGNAIHYLAASPDLDGVSGKYFNLTHEEKPAPHALDREVGQRIWDESIRLTTLDGDVQSDD